MKPSEFRSAGMQRGSKMTTREPARHCCNKLKSIRSTSPSPSKSARLPEGQDGGVDGVLPQPGGHDAAITARISRVGTGDGQRGGCAT